jgi:AcrR family transcriptional regulator
MIHTEPPAGRPSARRRDANLGRIIDAAIALVAESGLDGLSMARLAHAVDYTPGALYRYVDSKDALIAVVVGRILVDLRTALDQAVAARPVRSTPLTRVFALVRGYRSFVRREPHRTGLLALALAEPRILVADAEHTQTTARAVVAALTPMADAVTAAVAAELLTSGNPIERTLCLFAMLHGLSQLPKLARASPTAIDVDHLSISGTRSLLIGWGANARTVDAALVRLDA